MNYVIWVDFKGDLAVVGEINDEWAKQIPIFRHDVQAKDLEEALQKLANKMGKVNE